MSKKAVLGAVGSAVLGAAAGASAVGKHMDKERRRQKELADKHLALFVRLATRVWRFMGLAMREKECSMNCLIMGLRYLMRLTRIGIQRILLWKSADRKRNCEK